ncbi:MAG: hypothetical protein LBG52_09040 [Candidatus Peribacteria bacterium]|jgi:hypothetical protein|nr:hypothetical protein [Candidatus Peribacteria bacterium]
MKKLVVIVLLLCGATHLSAQENVKLSGNARVTSLGLSGVTGVSPAKNVTADFTLAVSVKHLSLNWVTSRDLVDKKTKANWNYFATKYAITCSKVILSPGMFVLLFDEYKSSSLVAPTVFASYTGKIRFDGFVGYGYLFDEPNMFISNVSASKSFQDYTFKVDIWENVKVGKSTTTGGIQLAKKLFTQNSVSTSVQAGWRIKDALAHPEHFYWVGLGVSF